MTRRKNFLIAVAAVVTLATVAGVWVVKSGWLEDYIVRRAKQEVEQGLGAKLEIGKLRLDVWRGRATIDNFVVRGKETASEPALIQAKQLRIDIGLRSFSQSRVDLRGLALDEAKIRIVEYADGTTNIPTPRRKTQGRPVLETIVNWRLGKLDVNRGEFSYNDQKTPFSIGAEDFKLHVDYLLASRSYQGTLDTTRLRYQHATLPVVAGSTNVEFGITSEKIRVDRLVFRAEGDSVVRARGNLMNLDRADEPLKAEFDLEANLAVEQVLPFLRLPLENSGRVLLGGKLLFEAGRGVELHGDAKVQNVFYSDSSTRLGPLKAAAKLDLLPKRFTLSRLEAQGFGGRLDGNFSWDEQEGWQFDGDLANLELVDVLAQLNVRAVPWKGQIEGPVQASGGSKPLKLDADLAVKSTAGPSALEGLIALRYNEASNKLVAGESFLALPHSRLRFSGDLSKGINVEFHSTLFRELEPLVELAGMTAKDLPVGLDRGSLNVSGMLTGSLRRPKFHGTVEAAHLIVQGRDVDQVGGTLDYSEQLLVVEQLQARAMGAVVKGDLRAAIEDGKLKPDSLLSGVGTVRVADMAQLPLSEKIAGAMEASFVVRGSVDEPSIEGTVKAPVVIARELKFERVSGSFGAARRELKVPQWEATFHRQPVRGALQLRAGGNDWKIGAGNVALKLDGLPIDAVPQLREHAYGMNAQLTTDAMVDFTWSPEGVAPSKIDGKLALNGITRFGRQLGQLEFTSRTTGQRAALTATGNIRNQPIKGDATIQLGTKLDTELRLQFPRLDFPTIAQLFREEILPAPLPYEGGAAASFYFKGPLMDPQKWDGRLTIPQLQLAPNKEYVRETLPKVSDVVLKNEQPIVIEFRRGLIQARDMKFLAKDTNLAATVQYRTASKTISGTAKGTVNLAILSTLKPDLLAAGVASLDASVQGTSDDPQLNGRLTFANASFYLRDVITGLDKVNGAVLFDNSRATIETLKAQTGGGDLQLGGFVGFGRVISYRLQAQATQVRLRYPEGVSTSANATLALTGTTAQSILTGTVTILRSTIGQIDSGQLLAGGGGISDVATPVSNEFLKNLQFDVRVEAAQNIEIATAFTKDVKGEIALRLRGTPQRPIVLGRVAITQGVVDFFGSRYEVNRGEVTFNNPLKVEPVVALDLETRVRGVAISINLNGPANKLNMSYRSDPPMQSSEILALLAVGRTPNSTTSSVAQPTPAQSQGLFGGDSSMIVGAAVSAGINGRLQRFFGISRVRLDPQLTGIDNVPQARLTLEQQVSRDVTLTYITNLNRTQQQIVRIDWDISRAWSVVAVRDENGIFGIDINFRKRVK